MRSYNSFLTTNNVSQVISIYKDYIKDPNLVDKSWHDFFNTLAPEAVSYTHLTLPTTPYV